MWGFWLSQPVFGLLSKWHFVIICMIELLPNDLPDLPFGGWHATSSPELRIAACAFCAGVNPAYHEKDV